MKGESIPLNKELFKNNRSKCTCLWWLCIDGYAGEGLGLTYESMHGYLITKEIGASEYGKNCLMSIMTSLIAYLLSGGNVTAAAMTKTISAFTYNFLSTLKKEKEDNKSK